MKLILECEWEPVKWSNKFLVCIEISVQLGRTPSTESKVISMRFWIYEALTNWKLQDQFDAYQLMTDGWSFAKSCDDFHRSQWPGLQTFCNVYWIQTGDSKVCLSSKSSIKLPGTFLCCLAWSTVLNGKIHSLGILLWISVHLRAAISCQACLRAKPGSDMFVEAKDIHRKSTIAIRSMPLLLCLDPWCLWPKSG